MVSSMDQKGRVRWWDSNLHDTFWGLCSSAESTALLEADGPDDKASSADTVAPEAAGPH